MAVGFSYTASAQLTPKDGGTQQPKKITCSQYAQNIYNDWRGAGFPPSVAHEQEAAAYKDCRQKEKDNKLKA